MLMNSLKNKLFLSSVFIGLASTISVVALPNEYKNVARVGIIFAASSLVLTELIMGKSLAMESEFNSQLRDKDRAIDEKVREINQLESKIGEINSSIILLKAEISDGKAVIALKDNQLAEKQATIHDLRDKLKEVGQFSTSEAYRIVRATYNKALKKVEALLDALSRNYPDCDNQLEPIYFEVDKFKGRYIKLLEEYEQIKTFNELLDTGLDLQEKIIDKCLELRIKAQSIIIRYLELINNDSIPYSEYENYISSLTMLAGNKLEELKAEREATVKAIASEWVASNEQILNNYNTEFQDILDTAKYATNRLQEMESLIESLQNQIVELSKPLQFSGVSDYAVVGNLIINYYFKKYQYVLDAITWLETETGYQLQFSQRRNSQQITADMLHDKDNREQIAGLSNALNAPSFEVNYQNGCLYLDIQLRKKPRKIQSDNDINKLWIPAAKFEQTVKGWSRVRLTGGSESGKSPTAENLAICILKNRPGTGKLYNPQHDSIKNYWTIPVVGTSHKDSEKAIANLAKQVDARSNGQESRESFELSIFDEIDSTMSHTKGSKKAIGDNVNFIIKQSSHQNLGAIFVGQNANVSEYPGMSRSDWNSAVNVHIGSNCYDAITNSNLFTTDEITRLKSTADKLTEFCSAKNDEFGLDKTDPNAYRFALVIEPNKKPYFIELPAFGTYTYTEIKQIGSGTILSSKDGSMQPAKAADAADEAPNIDSSVTSEMAAFGYVGVGCLKCNIGTLGTPKSSRGVKYYPCSHCGKSTSENVLKGK